MEPAIPSTAVVKPGVEKPIPSRLHGVRAASGKRFDCGGFEAGKQRLAPAQSPGHFHTDFSGVAATADASGSG